MVRHLCALTFLAASVPTISAAAPQQPSPPTEGQLIAADMQGESLGPCPLAHTDVQVHITGFVARATVTQQFHNPHDYKIEGVYVFPMSARAAVDDMTMKVGDRVVRGVIKPRDEARAIYDAAREAGHVAGLLDQERPNIFTQSVANIEPGEQVDIEIAYVETLPWADGRYEFSFPMVVGPRYMPDGSPVPPTPLRDDLIRAPYPVLKSPHVVQFRLEPEFKKSADGPLTEDQARACLVHAVAIENPGPWNYIPWHSFTVKYADNTVEEGAFCLNGLGYIQSRYFLFDPNAPIPAGDGWARDTSEVPDASRISPPAVPPEKRSGLDISIRVEIDAGAPLHDIKSPLHAVDSMYLGDSGSQAFVMLSGQRSIPNKDFVLTYSTATADIGDTLLTHYDERGGFFTLILQPPERVPTDWIAPREMIFVIDKSGSMSGFPIETAKWTMEMCIDQLHANDTFNLMTFSGGVSFCFDKPVPNTPENRAAAVDYLRALTGDGGTEMMSAVDAALGGLPDPERLRVVCFMTDGYVGNDMAIIDAVKKHAGTSRVFSFGIGTSVNHYLLDGMARAGRGEVEYVPAESQCAESAQRFAKRVSAPVLTDITLDWGDLPVEDVFPAQIPDLFDAKPVVVKGRYSQQATGSVTIRGRRSGEPFERTVAVNLDQTVDGNAVLASMWAREKVGSLMDQNLAGVQRGEPDTAIKQAIVDLGLAYRLMTQYTSFVAVEETTITRGGKPTKVIVPVETPAGVSYEGVFGRAAGDSIIISGNLNISSGLTAPTFSKRSAPPARPARGRRASGAGTEVNTQVEMTQSNLTSEQVREITLRTKLAAELQDLAQRVTMTGPYHEGRVNVTDGAVEVAVHLADASDETLKKLEHFGFRIVLQTKSVNMVIGTIAVSKLEELALMDEVRRVEPSPLPSP